jgi:hypothetical protein
MIELILFYITGMLVSSGIIVIWNFSSISIHLLGWIYKDVAIITLDDLADAIAEKHANISELLYCPICLGFWISVGTSSAFYYINSLNLWFIPISSFSWPLFIFMFYKLLNNNES